MTSGTSTKMPKMAMFGARKNAAMPPVPVARCHVFSGTLRSPASHTTGAASAAPARAFREESVVTATASFGLGNLVGDVLVVLGPGILQGQLARHHLADARDERAIIGVGPLPGRQRVRGRQRLG